MEDLIVTAKEHKLLKKFQRQLEENYKVEIHMPKTSSLDSDVVFISLHGENSSRDCVKKFLLEKKSQRPKAIEYKENAVVITILSDSEEETTSPVDDSICIVEPPFYSAKSPKSGAKQTVQSSSFDDSICVIETIKDTSQVKSPISGNNHANSNSLDDSICIIGSDVSTKGITEVMNVLNETTQIQGKRKRKRANIKKRKKVRTKDVFSSSDVGNSDLCEVSSTTDNMERKRICIDESVNEAVTSTKDYVNIIPLQNQNESPPHIGTMNYISFFNEPQPQNQLNIVMEPVPTRSLRPIVIDGNNVAIEHGRVSHSFSSKGIQLAIKYFLDRGHTQVTAFVPKFRRNFNPHHSFPTKDAPILDELAEKQLVVFTPSRRLNGKNIASYDDRFIVQLAATNGGVIVSNDNYRDLINESESFKEAIEQRLLMFCFVGDMFMVPEDPLGRSGPKLNDYLCFPLENKKDVVE